LARATSSSAGKSSRLRRRRIVRELGSAARSSAIGTLVDSTVGTVVRSAVRAVFRLP
jgi:hypothetical protein